jgi:vacuolar-type H+-ATPase subunit D/Vma8
MGFLCVSAKARSQQRQDPLTDVDVFSCFLFRSKNRIEVKQKVLMGVSACFVDFDRQSNERVGNLKTSKSGSTRIHLHIAARKFMNRDVTHE